MKIAVLQTGRSIDETRHIHGDYDDMCKVMLGHTPDEMDTFEVLDDRFPDDMGAYDAYLITGSRCGVYEDHSWIPPLEDFIRKAYAQDVKLIGVCFGHQIIAQALGGVAAKSDRGFGVGAMGYELVGDDGKMQSISLYAWHQDQVITPPQDAEVIASSDFCEFAGLRYGDKALTFQAHPEFTKEYMADLAEARRGSQISDEMSDAAMASLEKTVSADVIQEMMLSFLKA